MHPYQQKQKRFSVANLLKPLLQFPGIVKVVIKRQRYYPGLSLLALVNIILSVGLITNASFFSQAVDRVVLLQELRDFTSVTGRPPFSTSVYIFPSRRQPLTLENAEKVGRDIANTVSGEVGLPLEHLGTELTSGSMILLPYSEESESDDNPATQANLGATEVIYIADVAEQMEIIEGRALDEDGRSGEFVDVWLYDNMAQAMGVNIDDKMMLALNITGPKFPIQVAGIWRAADPESRFWFSRPDSAYKNTLLLRRNDYIERLQPMLATGSARAAWYIILDENQLVPRDGSKYLEGFQNSLLLVNKFLPGARMNMPPLDPLARFVERSATLTTLLLGYNLPAFAILLYFLVLTAAIMAQWQRRETVMLVSRGMSITGVLNLTLTEQLILFVVGYPFGIAFGMLVARLMGYTASFLSFTSREALPVSLEGMNLPLTILALSFALFSRLLPAARAARSSLVTEERERARPVHQPFWFRFYIDLILLVPTWYAYDQMVKRGSLAGLITDRPEDLYRDPLLIVVPALFILTASLVTMRIFSIFMRVLDLVASWIPWLTLHLALRQLGRQSLDYVRPLLLVIIALAMGVYTIAMATSLDQWLVDRMYYRYGADYTFSPETATVPDALSGETVADGSWIPLPYDFMNLTGVAAATRVGNFDMYVNPDTQNQLRGRFIGVDRAEFASVAWFREDFARESLGAMMNRLALMQESVLVPQALIDTGRYRIGDIITIRVNLPGIMSTVSEYQIVGTYDYFPTVYEDRLTFIGNLEHLATLSGLTPDHDIWLRLHPGADTKVLENEIFTKLHIRQSKIGDTRKVIEEEQSKMERVGIFGTLTVGFLSAALMSILGLLVYSYASLQERAYRLAVLNAVGLSRRQILAQVIIEYAFLALFGAVAGALIGLISAELFVPFFRYTGEQGIPLPPLLPIVQSDQLRNLSLAFGVTIILVEIISMASILNNRLVQILKRVWM